MKILKKEKRLFYYYLGILYKTNTYTTIPTDKQDNNKSLVWSYNEVTPRPAFKPAVIK